MEKLESHEDITSNDVDEIYFREVPPPTPRNCSLEYSCSTIPSKFPDLKLLEIPYIREIGIAECIDRLAKYFECDDYKCCLIQFWFLDIITECLWRAQDEFQFPETYQKIILEWILYVFDLIRAPHLNFSRRKVFDIFKEAMQIAEEFIESGCKMPPVPNQLFTLDLPEYEEDETDLVSGSSSPSNNSSMSFPSTEQHSYAAVKLNDSLELFELPQKLCHGTKTCASTSVETLTEQIFLSDSESEEEFEGSITTPLLNNAYRTFSSEEVLDESSSSSNKIDYKWELQSKQDIKCPETPIVVRTESKRQTLVNKVENEEQKQEEQILKEWYMYHLRQQQIKDMNNPNIGWIPPKSHESVTSVSSVTFKDVTLITGIKNEWLQYIQKHKTGIDEIEENIFVNSCVLLAIKQFVFEYFYETFQFNLIKAAFRFPHKLITQEMNTEWCNPKIPKGEFHRPPVKIIPKKRPSEVVPEKRKSQSVQVKDVKDKTEVRKSVTKKSKEEIIPTRNLEMEKEEMERLKKIQEALEEERRIEHENMTYIFPLSLAVDDDFFQCMFSGWVRPGAPTITKIKK